MNDTLDHFNFSLNTNTAFCTKYATSVDTRISSHSAVTEKPTECFDSGVSLNADSQITFDDTLFLSESMFVSFNQCEDVVQQTEPVIINVRPESPNICNEEAEVKTENRTFNSNHEVIEARSEKEDLSVFNCSHSLQQCDLVKSSEQIIEEDEQSTSCNCENVEVECDNNDKKNANESDMCNMSAWGLPEAVLENYAAKNIRKMFFWQVECLRNDNILKNNKNLIYSAPTSAGKTLVAEILAMKTVFERKKKVIFILPFVSIVREKMYYFQSLLSSSGIRVEGFMGSYNPPGGFTSVQVAVCTIEKANSLINRLLEEEALSDIGAILVDEIHLISDSSRGYLLELLLTKLMYISKKDRNVQIQIVGMSATLPNLDTLAKWLDAELFKTDFRPIPLYEQVVVCGEIYNKNFKLLKKLSPLPEIGKDTDHILQLCLETIKDSCSILIFCPTKNWCENLSQQIASAFFQIGCLQNEWGTLLRDQLNTTQIKELLEQLRYCPVGLDEILRKTVSFGVAFHHAGLTMDERDIIESAFRNGALRILVATSTLSSGVNLPARRVIIRTPMFNGKPIDILSYRQMIGRAGRMGRDSLGESFLICQKNDHKIVKELMSAEMRPIESCLEGTKLMRAILEVVASGVALTSDDIDLFTKCTLLAVEGERSDNNLLESINEAVSFLKENEFVRLQTEEDGTEKYVTTSLGKACLSSSMSPNEGLALFTELAKARQCFVLETELHLIYLVTPYSACYSWGTIDWMFYLDLWEKLPPAFKRVGELVGVKDSYIVNATRGKIQTNTNKSYHQLLVHKRFFVALALQDLVNEKPLGWVCNKFNCNRGMLQSLQQVTSTFAGMVTSFSRQLGWSSVELLISQFQDRLQFGVSRDLLELMRLSIMNGKMARTLYNGGIESVAKLANSTVSKIENIFHRELPFESEKERDGESEFEKKQRNKYRNVWIAGKEGLTEREAAEMLINQAREYIKLEMGLADAKWETSLNSKKFTPGNEKPGENACQVNKVGNETSVSEEIHVSSEHSSTSSSENAQELSNANGASPKKTAIILNNLDLEPEGADDSALSSVNVSNTEVKKQQSDRSFDDSFTLKLSESDQDVGAEPKVNCEGITDNSNSKKRKNLLFNLPGQKSVKKKRRTKTFHDNSSEDNINFSYYSNKLHADDDEQADFNKLEIVDVCADESLFDAFNKEVGNEKSIALSLSCTKYEEPRQSIGMGQQREDTNVDQTKKLFSRNGRTLNGFSISWGNNVSFYLSLRYASYQPRVINIIKTLLNDKTVRVKLFDSKEQIKVLKYCCGINVLAEIDDPKVADWILDPEGKEKNFKALVVKYCPETLKLTKLLGDCKGVGSIGLDCYSTVDPKVRSSLESVITWHLVKSLNAALKEVSDKYLRAYDIETKTLKCLAKIELHGICVKKELLQKLSETLKNLTGAIEKKAFSLAGRYFNFVSSNDVSKVLGLFRGKKVSTKKDVLEQSDHPIAKLVLEWRKINSTLTKMLFPLIGTTRNERIHGVHITHTATGRITMREPNLQNVARDFEIVHPIDNGNMKISCRHVFSSPEGWCLLSADYCQLELRILAHFSKDQALCRIFTSPGDVFKSIATKWNKLPEDEITDDMRQQTKGLCYGIIYGMSAKALALQLQTTETDAALLMDTFKNTYPGINSFVLQTLKNCRESGYVETVRGRRRYLPHINETDISKRGSAERQAVNTIIQGSAADIIKVSMAKTESELEELFHKTRNKPKLVLHLHDELIYEVPLKYTKKVARVMKRNMENSVRLSVPFPVKLKAGSSWGDMKEYAL